MQTNSDVLAKAAANFEAIAENLKTIVAKVQKTASGLDQHWKGSAADAAQLALERFNEAATTQVNELNDISNKIQSAGVKYSVTDDDRARALEHAMEIGSGV